MAPARTRAEADAEQQMIDRARQMLLAPLPTPRLGAHGGAEARSPRNGRGGGGGGGGHGGGRGGTLPQLARMTVESPQGSQERAPPTREGESRRSPRRYVPPHFPHISPRPGGTPAARAGVLEYTTVQNATSPREALERREKGLP
eukprot:551687-Prymnesium_polylepis.1